MRVKPGPASRFPIEILLYLVSLLNQERPQLLSGTCYYTDIILSVFSSLYGIDTTNSGWVVIRVNFTNIFTSKCGNSDFYKWTPYDEVNLYDQFI